MLNYLTTTKTKLTVKQAINLAAIICTEYSLTSEHKHAIAKLVQTAQGKELRATSINNPFKLASLFLPKNEVRYYLNYIHADGAYLIASTGHILIKVKHSCEAGRYNALGILQDINCNLPDFSKHIYNMSQGIETTLDSGKLFAHSKNISAYSYGETNINSDYYKVLKKIGVTTINIHSTGIYFKTDKFEGVVMHLRA